MIAGSPFGARGIPRQDIPEDLAVLGPDQRPLLRIVEHGPHRALQMRPLRSDRVCDRAVTRQPIERGVKCHISLYECEDWSVRAKCEAGCKRLLGGAALGRVDHPFGNALGGEPRRQGVERAADFIQLANPPGVDLRNDQPTPAIFLHQLLLLQQLQRVADRLPLNPERASELFLPDPLPGGERAVGDRRDQPLVGLVDQRRLRVERLHAHPEFGIR
jgi:hypothetical protein